MVGLVPAVPDTSNEGRTTESARGARDDVRRGRTLFSQAIPSAPGSALAVIAFDVMLDSILQQMGFKTAIAFVVIGGLCYYAYIQHEARQSGAAFDRDRAAILNR